MLNTFSVSLEIIMCLFHSVKVIYYIYVLILNYLCITVMKVVRIKMKPIMSSLSRQIRKMSFGHGI